MQTNGALSSASSERNSMPACCSQGSRAGERPPHTSRRTADRSNASPSQAAEATARSLWAAAEANSHAQPVGAAEVSSDNAVPHGLGQRFRPCFVEQRSKRPYLEQQWDQVAVCCQGTGCLVSSAVGC